MTSRGEGRRDESGKVRPKNLHTWHGPRWHRGRSRLRTCRGAREDGPSDGCRNRKRRGEVSTGGAASAAAASARVSAAVAAAACVATAIAASPPEQPTTAAATAAAGAQIATPAAAPEAGNHDQPCAVQPAPAIRRGSFAEAHCHSTHSLWGGGLRLDGGTRSAVMDRPKATCTGSSAVRNRGHDRCFGRWLLLLYGCLRARRGALLVRESTHAARKETPALEAPQDGLAL